MTRPSAPAVPTLLLALVVTVVVGASLWISRQHDLAAGFGDTDDALRLVIVRDLISGRAGWFDQHMMRLQPPIGMQLHWSRLIDGGLVALQSLLRLGLTPPKAELAMRALWPLLWIFPAAAAVLSIARRLGGDAAALAGAAMLVMDVLLYAQWIPGRIDHHNVQISLALLALAAAMRGGWRGALMAGAASGLGLAVGLEALPFQAVVGAAVALQFAHRPQTHGRPAQAYAAGLVATALPLYLAETPPARWTHAVCDAIAVNLVAALIVAGAGLIACVALTARRGPLVRLGGLAVVGAAAAAAYLALDPTCLHGPLAGADPRIGPIWLSHVNEMLPLSFGLADLRQVTAWGQAILMGLGAAAWLWLGRRRTARDAAWLMAGAWLAMGTALGLSAARMAHYPAMLATALVAAAVADLANRYARGNLLVMVVLAVAFIPTWETGALLRVAAFVAQPNLGARRTVCNTPQAYRRLAALPTGRVLGEIDLGPYVLVTSQHSVLAAPYHRMAWGILAAHDALAAGPGADEAATRRLGADYVLDCAAHANLFTHGSLPINSLQRRLDRGEIPPWLQPLSAPGDAVQVYAVKPRGAAAG